jgi:uncharacterized protein YdaU (DUF1376 family)
MSDHWFAFYPGDYLRDTAHLSLLEQGAYTLLLLHIYATGSPLPRRKTAIYRICRATTDVEIAAVDSVLAEFFELRRNGYHNARADRELAKRATHSARLSESGRAGAAKRWNAPSINGNSDSQANGQANGEANGLPMARPQPQPQPQSEEKPTHTPAVPSAPGVCESLLATWNRERGTLPEVLKLTKKRREKTLARVREDADFPSRFEAAVKKASVTPFLCGRGDRGWRASFDWLVANDLNVLGVLEGKYDGEIRSNGSASRGLTGALPPTPGKTYRPPKVLNV